MRYHGGKGHNGGWDTCVVPTDARPLLESTLREQLMACAREA